MASLSLRHTLFTTTKACKRLQLWFTVQIKAGEMKFHACAEMHSAGQRGIWIWFLQAHHLNCFSLFAIFHWSLSCLWLCSLSEPLFETHCAYAEATLEQFLGWAQDDAAADAGPFCKYLKSEYWAYADYKYIAMLFQDLPSMFEVIRTDLVKYLSIAFSFPLKVLKWNSASIWCNDVLT